MQTCCSRLFDFCLFEGVRVGLPAVAHQRRPTRCTNRHRARVQHSTKCLERSAAPLPHVACKQEPADSPCFGFACDCRPQSTLKITFKVVIFNKTEFIFICTRESNWLPYLYAHANRNIYNQNSFVAEIPRHQTRYYSEETITLGMSNINTLQLQGRSEKQAD
jgi:hypothetical protein